jgi:hypothetical protein
VSKWRRAAKVDKNQPDIVKRLRSLPGVTVYTGVDDIFVGYKNRNFWYEIKEPETVSKKTGEVLESKIKTTQKKLRDEWQGHYRIVWSVKQILDDMGIMVELDKN